MFQPFLFKFKQPCSTHFKGSSTAFYDQELDMILIKEIDRNIPAIQSTSHQIPATKKADIEKGDDQKDSLMWN